MSKDKHADHPAKSRETPYLVRMLPLLYRRGRKQLIFQKKLCFVQRYVKRHVTKCYLEVLTRAPLELSMHHIIPYPTAFPYGNGMVLHFYQQQESSTTKTVHKVINKGLKAYV